MKTEEEIKEALSELEGSENQAYNKDYIEAHIEALKWVLDEEG